jgi:RNA polymerase sigma-70 factor (ECF subfamily)
VEIEYRRLLHYGCHLTTVVFFGYLGSWIVKTMHLPDEILIARVAQGDVTAFEILYDRYAASTLGILVHILADRAVAEVLLQETFWQVWQTAEKYSSQTAPCSGWLFRIARSLAREDIKTRAEPGMKLVEK